MSSLHTTDELARGGRLASLSERLQAKLERVCRRLDMRLVPASSLAPDHALAAFADLNHAGWRTTSPPSARLPRASELADGSRETMFLEWRGCMVAMASIIHAEVVDGVRRSLSNVVSLPRGSGVRRFDERSGGFVPVPGTYLGGGGLTVHALVVRELRRIAGLDAGPRVDWIDAFPRLSPLPGLDAAECDVQHLLDDAGFAPFVLANPSSCYGERRALLAECYLLTGTEVLDPDAPIHLPDSASLQAAIVRATFSRAFGWTPPITNGATRPWAPPPPELVVQEFSRSSCAVWVSAPASLDRLRLQIAELTHQRPRKAVMINVPNHPANVPLMAALESWGCVPVGILPRWNGRPHRLCWSALATDEQRSLPPARLAARLDRAPLASLVHAIAERRVATSLATPPPAEARA